MVANVEELKWGHEGAGNRHPARYLLAWDV